MSRSTAVRVRIARHPIQKQIKDMLKQLSQIVSKVQAEAPFPQQTDSTDWELTRLHASGRRLSVVCLGEQRLLIGRDLQSDVVLKSSLISKRHAEIVASGPVVAIRDLGSRNGTFVNGWKVTSATPIGNGDQIQIGNVLFELRKRRRELFADEGSTSAARVVVNRWISASSSRLVSDEGLSVLFQPIVSTASRRLAGHEALTRIESAGFISADEQITLTARLKKSTPITHTSRMIAARQAGRLPGAAASLPLFFEVSSAELHEAELRRSLRAMREDSPELRVVVVIRDNGFTSPQDVRRFRLELDRLGFRLALDDFAGSRSRLEELSQVGIDFLMFDRGLIEGLPHAGQDEQSHVQSVVHFARRQGLKTIARGVATRQCFDVCGKLDFEYCQGRHTGAPAAVAATPPRPQRQHHR